MIALIIVSNYIPLNLLIALIYHLYFYQIIFLIYQTSFIYYWELTFFYFITKMD